MAIKARSERKAQRPWTHVADAEIGRQIVSARRTHQKKVKAGLAAIDARYDASDQRIHVEMSTGFSFGVPVSALRELRGASDTMLGEVEVDELGGGLVWESLEVQVSVLGILIELLGEHTVMAAAGRAGGSATSDVKAAAARANGAKGGRPRKAAARR